MSGAFGALGAHRKDTHAGHMQLAEKPQGSGGHPVQEWSEPTKAREKGGKNQKKKKSWRNSTAELAMMSNLTVRWWRLKKILRRDDRS